MKRTMKYITYVCAALLTVALYSCTDDSVVPEQPAEKDGTLLNLHISDIVQPTTRLAELGGSGNISQGKSPTNGANKENIGLYIYYQDDYDANNLTRPYVRNLECKVEGGKIVPLDNSSIYIYDRMTIVAFYPYNGAADDYTFKTKDDEKRYPITEGDYSYQFYIPYRAQANVNPTTAYYVELDLYPVQTTKIQVVLTTSNPDLFPEITDGKDGKVKLVPSIDPQDAASGEDKREYWVDIPEQGFAAPNPVSSGQYVRRYNAYIWKNNDPKSDTNPHHGDTPNHNDNTIKKGEILLKSGALTLFFPQDVEIKEGLVYRYGYNIDTGELFIPTSDALIYDAATLGATGGGYQVCDIDLKDVSEWTPVNLSGNSLYDGGGHAVKNMKISQLTTDKNAGLFGTLSANATVKNLHLESPEIDIDFSGATSTDTCHVGGLVGKLNRVLTPAEIEALLKAELGNLPPDLPQSVIDALVEDLKKSFTGGTSSIQGCKVSEPTITVKGNNLIAGGLAGIVGDNDKFKGSITNSYVLGGSIKVNEASPQEYENAQVGAFAGSLKSGSITNSYTTATAKAHVKKVTGTPPVVTSEEVAKGFTNVVTTPSGINRTVTDSYTKNLKDDVTGVQDFDSAWPGWSTLTEWPLFSSPAVWGSNGSSPSTYPTLIWESLLDIKKIIRL
jgi:hypothetical protein